MDEDGVQTTVSIESVNLVARHYDETCCRSLHDDLNAGNAERETDKMPKWTTGSVQEYKVNKIKRYGKRKNENEQSHLMICYTSEEDTQVLTEYIRHTSSTNTGVRESGKAGK